MPEVKAGSLNEKGKAMPSLFFELKRKANWLSGSAFCPVGYCSFARPVMSWRYGEPVICMLLDQFRHQ
ncbi:MAG: hypothetical protein ACWGOW_10025, partial [Gammaproteobacteria bacterium]